MNRHRNRQARCLVGSMAVLAMLAWAPRAHAAQCLEEAYGDSLNCTANDVEIASIEITNVTDPCTAVGDTLTFDGTLHIVTNATNRYDLGFYLGDNPLSSTNDDCSVSVLDPDELTPPQDGDQCGDVTDVGEVTLPVTGITVVCQDADQNGFFDINTCSTWRQAADSGDCNGPSQALPGTKSKCNCEIANTDQPVPAPEPQCATNADCPSDGNVCTDEVCNPGAPGADGFGCLEVNNTASCDDGLFCNGADVCSAGTCTHPGDPCTNGGVCGNVCNETTDSCFVTAGTVCRASAGICDTAETCTGSSGSCPDDAFVSSASTCRASAGVCDTAETCTGSSADCPADTLLTSTTTCRASAGVCDSAEVCNGSSAACPADGFQSGGTTCRASAGICDTPETCTGSSASCPADTLLTSTTTCRASAGICDSAEVCNGSSAACPADGFQATDTTCRASAGACDVAELCTGSSASCPGDAFQPNTVTCRAASGECSAAELCSGSSAACPSDANQPNGTPCTTDNDVCTDDVCTDGTCTHSDNTASCDDGLFCTVNDTCTNGQCAGSPRDCGSAAACADVFCDEANDICQTVGNDAACDDQNDCTEDICSPISGCQSSFVCETDICRSPGFWSTHSGYETKGKGTGATSYNVTQQLLDVVGDLQVCGQTLSSTSNMTSPYLSGLGLSSVLEGLCVSPQGDQTLQLYRQLVAAALNCAVSGAADDCDSVLSKYIDVSFTACSNLCAGIDDPNGPSVGECISELDCFNNGGQSVDGSCASGTCESDSSITCSDSSDCPLVNDQPQACVDFPNSCHSQDLCNEDIGFCPVSGPASSTSACKEARQDSCTLTSCP